MIAELHFMKGKYEESWVYSFPKSADIPMKMNFTLK